MILVSQYTKATQSRIDYTYSVIPNLPQTTDNNVALYQQYTFLANATTIDTITFWVSGYSASTDSHIRIFDSSDVSGNVVCTSNLTNVPVNWPNCGPLNFSFVPPCDVSSLAGLQKAIELIPASDTYTNHLGVCIQDYSNSNLYSGGLFRYNGANHAGDDAEIWIYKTDSIYSPPSTPSGYPYLNISNNSVFTKNQTFMISGFNGSTGYEFIINGTLKQNSSSNVCSLNCTFPKDGFFSILIKGYNTAGYGNSSFYIYEMDTSIQVMCMVTSLKACTNPFFSNGYWYCGIDDVIDCRICNPIDYGFNVSITACNAVSCNSDCSTQNAKSCYGTNSVQTCLLSDDGCYHQYYSFTCPSTDYCDFGLCRNANTTEISSNTFNQSDYSGAYYSDSEIAKRKTVGEKLLILLGVAFFSFGIMLYLGKAYNQTKLGFILGCISLVVVFICGTIPDFPVIGGFVPIWISILLIVLLTVAGVIFSWRPNHGEN